MLNMRGASRKLSTTLQDGSYRHIDKTFKLEVVYSERSLNRPFIMLGQNNVLQWTLVLDCMNSRHY